MEAEIESTPVKSDDEQDFVPKKITNNYRSLLDSDSEEDETTKQNSNAQSDSESESEIADKSLGKSRIISQSSDSSGSDNEETKPSLEKPVIDRRKNPAPKKKILPVKTQRKSASKAMEVIQDKMNHKKQAELKQEIQSEKQRMDREQDIRVPYHKPKQYSLKEFLARRTLNKPSLEKIKEGQKPVSSIVALKMTSEQLEKFAQKMKEREEEAIEFFKSESESDDEQDSANKENVSENPAMEVAEEDPVNNEVDACETEVGATLEVVQEEKKIETPVNEMEVCEEIEETPAIETAEIMNTSIAKVMETAKEPMDTSETAKVKLVIETSEMLKPSTNMEISEEKASTEVSIEKTSDDPELDRLREKYKNATPIKLEEIDVKPKISIQTLKTLNEMNSNDFTIDLVTGSIQPRKLTGPEMLFQKYLKTVQKPKHKDTISMNILTIENGKLENQKVEVKLDKEIEMDHQRPGFSHEMMKENLRNKIVHKRLEEIKKKMLKVVPKELEPEDKENCDGAADDECEESDGDFEAEDCEEQEESCEEEEVEVEMPEKRKKKKGTACGFLDEEAVDEDESENESEEDEASDESSSSSDEEPETETAVPKKGRILKAFEDSDDESSKKTEKIVAENVEMTEVEGESEKTDEIGEEMAVSEPLFTTQDLSKPTNFEATQDDLFASPAVSDARTYDDIFSTQPSTFDEPSISEEFKDNGIEGLCDPIPSQMVDDDDLMEICSGRFAPTQVGVTQNPQATTETDDGFGDSQFDSQVPDKEMNDVIITAEDIEVKIPSPEVKNARKMLDSTDDEAEAAQTKEKRKKKKKRKQKVKKLGFSDDEDDEASNQQTELVESCEDEELLEECEEEEQAEVMLDYDSEENEIEVKMNQKDRVKAAGAYFENEAELSESEWGSADEDEKDLDKFDIELGDEDQFDQNKLREEVGRIHARKVLDDDIRNVKKLQELLFEDEENDGIGRERKFRWKNQTEGFAMEDENARDGDALDAAEAEDESEISWRKMRHERETMLSEQSQKMTESDTMSEDILLLDHNSQTVTSSSTSMMVKRKFHIIKSTSSMGNSPVTTPDTVKKDSPFLIKTSNLKKFQSSSFLSRDEKTLTSIAKFVSYKDDEVTNTMSSHGGNSMSFATIDKPDDSKKRKSDGNQRPESSKKRKVETQPKSFLLDQLN